MGLLRRWLSRSRPAASTPSPIRTRDMVRAVVLGEDVEQIADVVRQQREQRERDAEAKAEIDTLRHRRDASAKWIERECRARGCWFPEDYR